MSRHTLPTEASAGSTQTAQIEQLRVKRWWQRCHAPLLGLLLATAAVRCVALDRPLVGQFATKNVVYAMIARNWARGEASFSRPTIDVLKNGQKGWHLLEVPLAAYVAGAGWHYLGGSLDVWGRGVSVACSVAAVALMFALVQRWHGETAAWGASVALALSPVSVIYGQMFMLEASVVMLTLLTLWSAEVYLVDEKPWAWWLYGASSVAMLLTKSYLIALLVIPLGVSILRADPRGVNRKRVVRLAIIIVIAMIPWAIWYFDSVRVARASDPEQSRVFYSLLDSFAAHAGTQQLVGRAVFVRRLLDDLSGIVLTPLGFVLALVALTRRDWLRHLGWLLASALLVIFMPRKFYELSYYHLVTLPVLCVLVGLGWQTIRTRLELSRGAIAGALLVAMVFSARYSYTPAFTIPAEDRYVVAAAETVRATLPADEPIATLHGSTFDLLYYCDRAGWGLNIGADDFEQQLNDVRSQGGKHLVVTGLELLDRHPQAQAALARLAVKTESTGYRIYELGSTAE